MICPNTMVFPSYFLTLDMDKETSPSIITMFFSPQPQALACHLHHSFASVNNLFVVHIKRWITQAFKQPAYTLHKHNIDNELI